MHESEIYFLSQSIVLGVNSTHEIVDSVVNSLVDCCMCAYLEVYFATPLAMIPLRLAGISVSDPHKRSG